jgi:uncharacterized repeat protein (TIGR03803 family)
MTKILLGVLLFLQMTLGIDAQTLIGTSSFGGPNGGGTIRKFMPATNEFTIAYSLQTLVLSPGRSSFVQASNGKLYGNNEGGAFGAGVIFSFDPATQQLVTLKDLDSANGSFPMGNLVQASDGKLYGMTNSGGAANLGVIFSFDPGSNTYQKLKDFNGTDGAHPEGSLTQGDDGKLYGMTFDGGPNAAGVIFSFDPATSTYTVLRNFGTPDGVNPHGSLLKANDGKFYGMTYFSNNESAFGRGGGVIFSFDPVTSGYMVLKELDIATDGGRPFGTLIQGSTGLLYGVTSELSTADERDPPNGYGTIFSINPTTAAFTKLHDFNNTDGASPRGSVVEAAGKLYGMTFSGGTANNGVIFSFDLSAGEYSKLSDLQGVYGSSGTPLLAADGNLYGMTNDGGVAQRVSGGVGHEGYIFSINPGTGNIAELAALGTNETGTGIADNPVQATNGLLYGMTTNGGSNGAGVIFSFDLASSTYIKLKDLDSADGGRPNGSLVQATNGLLYGLTTFGGMTSSLRPQGYGVLFSFDPATSTYSRLVSFDSINGANPYGSLLQATDGKLYGMTAYGGADNAGTIFSFDPATATLTRLKSFDLESTTDGGRPFGSLVQAADGNLYGLTSEGGNNWGIIFSFNPLSAAFSSLHEFDVVNGRTPYGSLVKGTNGVLYGVTSAGGSAGNGVLFSYDPAGAGFVKLVDFDGTRGAFSPSPALLAASNGLLYGSRHNEGRSFSGLVYSFDPATSNLATLQEFTNSYGVDQFLEINGCLDRVTYYQDSDADGFGNPGQELISCTQPEGYVTDSTDCDDHDNSVHAPSKYFRDADGDGFGSPTDSTIACTQPGGYVTNNTDCDDSDKRSQAPSTYYRDADHDGLGDGNSPITVCGRPPRGYVKNNLDCDDHHCSPRFWGVELKMCHNGHSECVSLWHVFRKLRHGWTLGPCTGNNADARSITGTGRKEYSKHALAQENSLSNYPNPFTGSSTIRYQLATDSRVSIKVYDGLGRVVSTLVDEYKKAGNYSVKFNAGRTGSGALFYRIIANSKDGRYEQTNKMVLLR